MSIVDAIILFLAGYLSGIVNAMAGGGTFITFGAMSLLGTPPILANATSSVTQFPGYITSTLAYWSDIRKFWRGALVLCAASAAGAFAGSLILLALDNVSFNALVPWLLLAATALFSAGPWLRQKHTRDKEAGARSLAGPITQFFTSIYGGFFGAGMGVMMLATLGLTESGGYHRINALKNMLAMVIASLAIVVFVVGDVVAWPQALVMIPGGALGGYSGVWIAKRVPQGAVRAFVVAVGLFLAVYYFVKP